MKKKTIPFDISKMKPDFSNVVYRDGTRPLFVCERKDDDDFPIASIDKNGDSETHTYSGLILIIPETESERDLLLEVEQSYPSLEELTEDLKAMMPKFTEWIDNQPSEITDKFINGDFDTVYTDFLNSQNK